MVSAGGARNRLVTAMNAGEYPGPIPSQPASAIQQWTNTYKSLHGQANRIGARNPQQLLMMKAAQQRLRPTGGRGAPAPDPKAYLLQLMLRRYYNLPGVFYGR